MPENAPRQVPSSSPAESARGRICPLRGTVLLLTEDEHKAFVAIAAFLQLEPGHFLWSCLNAIMGQSYDEDLLAGCAGERFEEDILPSWSLDRPTPDAPSNSLDNKTR